MNLTETTGTPTLNKHVRHAGVPVVPENELSVSWQHCDEGLRHK